MIVHRFMSDIEYRKLMAGYTLRNTTIHAANGWKTSSVGFCFFKEKPEEAIKWLSFIVDTDWCVTFDIPKRMLKKSRARYRDPNNDTLFNPSSCFRNEYSMEVYSLKTCKIIDATDKYKNYCSNIINQILSFFGRNDADNGKFCMIKI